jgi:hypothetical protein
MGCSCAAIVLAERTDTLNAARPDKAAMSVDIRLRLKRAHAEQHRRS